VPLPNLHIADISKLGKRKLSMQKADSLGENVTLRE
jgi:hypothetical protein